MADGMSTRRVVAAVLGVGALSLGVAAPAASQPPPNCSSADLYTHPPVNAFFTTIGDLDPEQRRVALAEFLDTNPQIRAELQGIRAPAVDFRNRCGREIPELGEN